MLFSAAFVALVAAAPALSAPVALKRSTTSSSTGLARRSVSFLPVVGNNVDVPGAPLEQDAPEEEENQDLVDDGAQDDVAQDEIVEDEIVQDEVVDENIDEEVQDDVLVDVNDPELLAQAEATALQQLTDLVIEERLLLDQLQADLEQQIADAEEAGDDTADLEAQLEDVVNKIAINDIQQQLLADGLVVLEQEAPEVDPELQALLDQQAELLAQLEIIKQQIAELEAAGEDVAEAEELMAGAEEALEAIDEQVEQVLVDGDLDEQAILAELIAKLEALTQAELDRLVDELNNGGEEALDILIDLGNDTANIDALVQDLIAASQADAAALDAASVDAIVLALEEASLKALNLQTAVAEADVVEDEVVEDEIVEDEVVEDEVVEDEVVEDNADADKAALLAQLQALLEQLIAQGGALRRRRALKL